MKYIVRNPEIMGGAPVITGTRIPAIRLLWLVRHGYTEQNLREEFPHVSRKKMSGALAELMQQGLDRIEQTGRERRPTKTKAAAR